MLLCSYYKLSNSVLTNLKTPTQRLPFGCFTCKTILTVFTTGGQRDENDIQSTRGILSLPQVHAASKGPVGRCAGDASPGELTGQPAASRASLSPPLLRVQEGGGPAPGPLYQLLSCSPAHLPCLQGLRLRTGGGLEGAPETGRGLKGCTATPGVLGCVCTCVRVSRLHCLCWNVGRGW